MSKESLETLTSRMYRRSVYQENVDDNEVMMMMMHLVDKQNVSFRCKICGETD